MKINDQHSQHPVKTEKQMRSRVRDKTELALADGSKTFVLSLNNPNTGKQVTTNLLKDGDGVKYMLLDKVVYDKRKVYALLKAALEL